MKPENDPGIIFWVYSFLEQPMQIKPIFRSVRGKIISWAFVPTVLVMAAVAFLSYFAYQQVAESIAIERDRYFTDLAALQLSNQMIDEYQNLLNEYTGVLAQSFIEIQDTEDLESALQNTLLVARGRLEIFDGGVLVLNVNGQVVATTPERYDVLGENWGDRDYFRYMLRSPGPIFSEIVPDGTHGGEVVVLAIPITGDQGQYMGLVAGMLQIRTTTTSSIADLLFKMFANSDRRPYLVDGNGVVIYHHNPGEVWQNYAESPIVQQVLEGKVGAEVVEIPGVGKILVGYAPVPGTNWGVVTETDWGILQTANQRYGTIFLLLLSLGIIAQGIVLTLIQRQIVRPVSELTLAAQEVAAGDFGEPIQVKTGDEIETLATSFNQMSAQLQTRLKENQEAEAWLSQTVTKLDALNRVSQAVTASLNTSEILAEIISLASFVVPTDFTSVILLDDEGKLNQPVGDLEGVEALTIQFRDHRVYAELAAAVRHRWVCELTNPQMVRKMLV